jgi:signal transduction histidine kinase
MVGYTREDLAAGRIRWPEMTPPEYVEISRRAEEELLSRGTCRTFEKEYIRKDGSRIPVLIGASILNEKSERLCFVLDLTERKRAEAALREVRHMESLGFLAGGVAHNLNNLLVAMMGSASLLLETSALSLEDRELADGILVSSERAANLTRQLLAYAGKGGFLARSVELSELISGLADVFRSSIPKNIDLRLDLDRNLPPIHADESQMSQLVTELVMNASEAIDRGPGEIELTTRVETMTKPSGEPLELGELSPGRHIVIRVTDTGSGMDERTLARAFDPFFSTKFAGRGLGLAALAGIVRSHSGGVRITSAPGKGSSFTVYLPVPE